MSTQIFLKRLLSLLAVYSLFSFVTLSSVQAGCGCVKPPPAPPAPPIAVIPNVAFPGMTLSVFSDSFKPGQKWQVVFRNGSQQVTIANVKVLRKWSFWDLDANGKRKLKTPRLHLALPPGLPTGPTSIELSRKTETLTLPASAFTVIGSPVVVSQQNTEFITHSYTTAVDGEGTLYLSLDGLANVCDPMKFHTLLMNNPLRYSYGDVVIINSQGFLIESLGPLTSNHFSTDHKNAPESDRMTYWRHSFSQYCADHRPGGAKEIDPRDPDWHKDGTPHVDYATLIFAIAGHYDDNSRPQAGPSVFDLKLETEVNDDMGGWQDVQEPEDLDHH